MRTQFVPNLTLFKEMCNKTYLKQVVQMQEGGMSGGGRFFTNKPLSTLPKILLHCKTRIIVQITLLIKFYLKVCIVSNDT